MNTYHKEKQKSITTILQKQYTNQNQLNIAKSNAELGLYYAQENQIVIENSKKDINSQLEDIDNYKPRRSKDPK